MLMIMSNKKPVKKVYVDKYRQNKEHYDSMKDFIDVKPVDLYGNCMPMGKSQQNLEDAAQDIKDRFSCC